MVRSEDAGRAVCGGLHSSAAEVAAALWCRRQQPLIIRGPGAGAEVTAGGVFSDLLRLAAYLGAPS